MKALPWSERVSFMTLMLHLGNGALYWNNDPELCARIFEWRLRLSRVLFRNYSLHTEEGYLFMKILCEIWTGRVSEDTVNAIWQFLRENESRLHWFGCGDLYNSLGVAYRLRGENDVAQWLHLQALEVILPHADDPEYPMLEARIRSNLARAYLPENIDGAWSEVFEALEIVEKQGRGSHFREETIFHVYTTYISIQVLSLKDEELGHLQQQLRDNALAGMREVYGEDTAIFKKYEAQLDYLEGWPMSLDFVETEAGMLEIRKPPLILPP